MVDTKIKPFGSVFTSIVEAHRCRHCQRLNCSHSQYLSQKWLTYKIIWIDNSSQFFQESLCAAYGWDNQIGFINKNNNVKTGIQAITSVWTYCLRTVTKNSWFGLGKQSLEKKSRKNSMCHSLSLSSLDVKSWTWADWNPLLNTLMPLYKTVVKGQGGFKAACVVVILMSQDQELLVGWCFCCNAMF